ncbi:MAG: hypothetical protein V4755_18645, partial [Curtobacterium sp.]
MTDPKDNVPNEDEPQVEGDATNAQQPEDLIEAEGPDVEVPTDGPAAGGPAPDEQNDLSPEDEALLADAARGIAEDKLSSED